MTPFEQMLLAILGAAEQVAPIFIHSQKGTVILNASEELVNAVAAQVSAKNAAGAGQTVTATVTTKL